MESIAETHLAKTFHKLIGEVEDVAEEMMQGITARFNQLQESAMKMTTAGTSATKKKSGIKKKAPATKKAAVKKKAPATKKAAVKKKAPATKKVAVKKKAPATKKVAVKKKAPATKQTTSRKAVKKAAAKKK
jgi:colicin import membrane protein